MCEHYSCREAFDRLDDFLDRELSAEEMAMVREHLRKCGHCATEFQFEEEVLQELKAKLARIDLPPELIDCVGRAIERACTEPTG